MATPLHTHHVFCSYDDAEDLAENGEMTLREAQATLDDEVGPGRKVVAVEDRGRDDAAIAADPYNLTVHYEITYSYEGG